MQLIKFSNVIKLPAFSLFALLAVASMGVIMVVSPYAQEGVLLALRGVRPQPVSFLLEQQLNVSDLFLVITMTGLVVLTLLFFLYVAFLSWLISLRKGLRFFRNHVVASFHWFGALKQFTLSMYNKLRS